MTAMVKESRDSMVCAPLSDERVPSDAALKMLKEHSEGNRVILGEQLSIQQVWYVKSQCNRYIFAVGCEEVRMKTAIGVV